MRKNIFVRSAVLFLVVVFLALLASCASTVVQVKDHIPAKINMSGLKNLAIREITVSDNAREAVPPLVRTVSTGDGTDQLKVFTRYNPLLCKQLAERFQKGLTDGLYYSGYFNLIEPKETERLFDEGGMLGAARQHFMENKIDAILSLRLSLLSFDEFITSENRPIPPSEGKTVTDFHLNTSAVLVFDYKILDVAQNCLVASDNFNKKIEDRSLVATYEKKADGTGGFTYMVSSAPSLDYQFGAAVDEIASIIPYDMVPRWEYSYEALVEGDESDKAALELAGAGDLDAAFKIFDAKWQSCRSLPAGYNAAILLYAKGRLSDAILYMEDVADRTGSAQAGCKLSELKETQRLGSIAERQLSGQRPDATVEEFEIRDFFGE